MLIWWNYILRKRVTLLERIRNIRSTCTSDAVSEKGKGVTWSSCNLVEGSKVVVTGISNDHTVFIFPLIKDYTTFKQRNLKTQEKSKRTNILKLYYAETVWHD